MKEQGERIVWHDEPRGWRRATTHPLLGATVVRIPPAVCPPRGAPLTAHERMADAVVVSVWRSPGRWGTDFDARTVFELSWPDGGTTWHPRHHFEPILEGQPRGR